MQKGSRNRSTTLDDRQRKCDGDAKTLTTAFQAEAVADRANASLSIRDPQSQNPADRLDPERLCAILANDLRDALTVLRDLTHFTSGNLDSYTSDILKKVITLQQAATGSLLRLLENLILWSQNQCGMIEYRPEPIEVSELISYQVVFFEPAAEQKDIRLRNLARGQAAAYGDPEMIQTILRNLISNALKFTHAGGTVEISARQNCQVIEIVVADTGIGIEERDLPTLFQSDGRCRRAGTAGEKGAGLGLRLCKDFVERHGGKIQVESTVGKGSVFRVTLPRNQSDSPS